MSDHEQRVREYIRDYVPMGEAQDEAEASVDALKAERDQLRTDLAEARDYGDRWRAKANEDHEARKAAEAGRLRAERDEALRAASDNLHSFKLMEKSRDNWREASDRKLGRIEKLSREVERLREALERLLDNGDAPHPLSGRDPTVRWDDVEHARAALVQPTEARSVTERNGSGAQPTEGPHSRTTEQQPAMSANPAAQPTEGQERCPRCGAKSWEIAGWIELSDGTMGPCPERRHTEGQERE